jgi:hypothetical protein
MRRPTRDSSKFDSRPEGHPYGDYQWKDEKPAVDFSTVKQGVLKAGYDLSNCFVAAAKDPGLVTVKILDRKKITIQKTLQKCTCKFPWKYVREAGGQPMLCFWRIESWFAPGPCCKCRAARAGGRAPRRARAGVSITLA